MFEGFRIKRRMLKVAHSWDLSINDLQFEDKLALTIIVHIMGIKEKSSIFKNKYVCTDAALLSTFYTFKRMYDYRLSDSVTKTLLLRVCKSCIKFFNISNSDMSKILNNRTESFLDTLLNVDSLEAVANEASFLFTYDVEDNKFVEYTDKTPFLLTSFNKKFQIEAESTLFFKTMGTMIDNLFIEEFHPAGNSKSITETFDDSYLGFVTQEMLEDYALELGISLQTALFLINQNRRLNGVSELNSKYYEL